MHTFHQGHTVNLLQSRNRNQCFSFPAQALTIITSERWNLAPILEAGQVQDPESIPGFCFLLQRMTLDRSNFDVCSFGVIYIPHICKMYPLITGWAVCMQIQAFSAHGVLFWYCHLLVTILSLLPPTREGCSAIAKICLSKNVTVGKHQLIKTELFQWNCSEKIELTV